MVTFFTYIDGVLEKRMAAQTIYDRLIAGGMVVVSPTDPAVIAYQTAQTAATNANVAENAARFAGAQALYNHTQNGLTAAMCKALFGVDIVP